ncbi:expressed unknown protein [Seminavis robusta]|uniref:Uncharacterized protein n=1 Tax=Seminavis robusta TaxID=568900 RepID=A0A9N8DD47_9STRA|nr:expressed unknown protein [Seminavis robusta]|eukprot:Sro68_g038230.1 n/a (314) ;mRNA; r:90172-91232
MAPRKSISVSDRIGALEECAIKFKDHLIDTSGVALTAILRLAVAQCARDAVYCKECAKELPRDACLRPGTKIYGKVAAIHHSVPRLEGVSDQAEQVIVTIVHTMVNHQGRMDKDWYDDSLEAISKVGLVPESVQQQEKRHCLVISAFAEIMCIATMSHGINMAFLTMGRPVPRLPSQDEILGGTAHGQGPLLLDWSTILKKAPTQDLSVAFAYHFKQGDIDKKSKDYLRISEKARRDMKVYGDPLHPSICLVFAAEDIWMLHHMESIYYIPEKDMMALFRTRLDPTVRCANEFSRFDVEFVAHEVAANNNCGY